MFVLNGWSRRKHRPSGRRRNRHIVLLYTYLLTYLPSSALSWSMSVQLKQGKRGIYCRESMKRGSRSVGSRRSTNILRFRTKYNAGEVGGREEATEQLGVRLFPRSIDFAYPANDMYSVVCIGTFACYAIWR